MVLWHVARMWQTFSIKPDRVVYILGTEQNLRNSVLKKPNEYTPEN